MNQWEQWANAHLSSFFSNYIAGFNGLHLLILVGVIIGIVYITEWIEDNVRK